MIQVSAKHQVVAVPIEPKLESLFPDAKRVTHEGNDLIVLPHEASTTILLRNMGIDVPAPVTVQYDWEGGKPFDVQVKTVALLTTHQRAYVLNGMGTGKTKAALWAWRFLNRQGQANKLLVVAPLSTLSFTWQREIVHTLPGIRAVVLHGDRAKRTKLLETDADIYIINHDGVGVLKDELAKRTDIDSLVLDELAVYRNGQSSRTKAMTKLATRFMWVWGMTGSPTPNAPTDAWGQCRILTPHTVPRYFTRFRDDVMNKISQFRFVPKPNAIDVVHAAMQPAVRFTLDDVVELPDVIERTIDISMGKKQEQVYNKMRDHAHAAVASGEITAMNAGAVLNKLLQISLGWVYTRDGNTVALDNEARIEALVDAIGSTDRKLLVFVPFKHALAGIYDRLVAEGYDIAPPISGDTSGAERSRLFSLFQNTDKYKILIAHPQCLAHGITLTAADTIVWFGPTMNLEIFDQANARIRRVGQKHKQQILMFCATAVERRAYAMLRRKQNIQSKLLSLFEDASE